MIKKIPVLESIFLLTSTWVDIGQTGTKISQKLKTLSTLSVKAYN